MAGDYYRRDDMNGRDYTPAANDPLPVADVMQGKLRNQSDYYIYSLLYGLPVIGDFMRAYGDTVDMTDYLSNMDIDWTQVKGWRRPNSGIAALSRRSFNYIGDMVKELYL